MMLRFASMLCVGMLVVPCALGETRRADPLITGGKVLTLDKDFSIHSALAGISGSAWGFAGASAIGVGAAPEDTSSGVR